MAIDKISDPMFCCGCGACKSICSQNAIKMTEDEEGFLHPVILQNKCISCGVCQRVCPANHPKENTAEPGVYAARRLDISEVLSSSSGGVFSALAEKCISDGGVVFGAVWNDDLTVSHASADTSRGIQAFKGSKYVQSDLKNTFLEVRELLRQQQKVLFSGTPCQIDGLKNFLGKEDPNLLTVDVICHGVPSPKLLREYLELRQKEFELPIKTVSFRDKRLGWSYSSTVLSDGKTELSTLSLKDMYYYGFLNNLYLRESCHHCRYKGCHIQADITLADYWGAEGKLTECNKENGISLVFTHSERGRAAFDSIKSTLDYEEKRKSDVLRIHNKAYEESTQPNKKRAAFWRCYRKRGLAAAMNRYCKDPLSLRLYYKLRATAKKILK